MVDALIIIRLAPAWDTPAIRAELQGLPQAIAARAADGVIYKGRNTLTRLSVAGREVVAKAFATPRTLLKRLQRVGRESKAVRAFDHAERMQILGIGTPEPLAVIAAHDGRSWYLCAWADGFSTLRQLRQQDEPRRRRLYDAVGAFIGRMHQAGAYHYDSTPGNVLVRYEDETPVFLVVDCNRMRFGRIGAWSGLRSLVQIEWRGYLLESYCATRGWNPARVRWMYRLRLKLERWNRALKDMTRPLRRKIGV